ncbi:MAG: T9SS type A sorting domain-containing protein [Balneolales bacterium]
MLQSKYDSVITALVFGLIAGFFALPTVAQAQEAEDNGHLIVIDIIPPGQGPARTDSLFAGDTLKFQGLPFPLHLLNGGELHLPEEAVVEDIRIEISLPDFSEISESAPQEVGFGQNIANAIQVNVYVNDELVSPYAFAEPVELTLPIPENRPQGIGPDVSEFVLAYTSDGEDFDPQGIATVISDTVKGLVSAKVDHFSNIAMTSDQAVTSADDDRPALPARVRLEKNYPNPFNPVTNIRFAIPEQMEVRLEVYNTLGQSVAVLKNELMHAGYHTVSWDASSMPSGVYLYRLNVGDDIRTEKMTLVK